MDIELRTESLRAVVSTNGGCLLAFDFLDGPIALMRPYSPATGSIHPTLAAAFPLIPFANRVRGGGFRFEDQEICFRPNLSDGQPYLHGDAWLGEWRIVERSSRFVQMAFTRAADAVSPYAYTAEQVLSLDGNGLRVELSVTNDGRWALPFGLGHHPYFPWRPGAMVRVGKHGAFWTEGFDYLPARPMSVPDDLRFDDFAPPPRRRVNNVIDDWDGRAWVRWPDVGLELAVEASEAFRWLMLFINTPERDPGYRFDYFCLEPMTHSPGGHGAGAESGFTVLAPRETMTANVLYSANRAK